MHKRWRWWWGLMVLVAACGAHQVYHRVRPGETLARIARAYGVPYQEIAHANRIADPSRIAVGQRLRIPGASHEVTLPPLDTVALAPLDRNHGHGRPRNAPRLDWPAIGTVTSAFGERGGRPHDGIDISAPLGAPVRAAADGDVAYGGALPGYGNVIIVRHARGYVTVYAHNDLQHPAAGTHVRRGQLIATVGRSGRTTGPNLHFEVRWNNVAYDPLLFLPTRSALRSLQPAVPVAACAPGTRGARCAEGD